MSLTDFFGGLGSDIGSLFSGSSSGDQSGQNYVQSTPQQQVQTDIANDPTGGQVSQSMADFSQPVTSTTPTTPSGGGSTSFFGGIGNWLSQPSNLAKLGLGAAGLGMGLYQTNQAQKQGAAAQSAIANIPENLKAVSQATTQQLQQISQQYQAMVNNASAAIQGMSQPMMQEFTQLLNLTNQGKLTPANKQIMDAARAQIAQSAANSGGVGAEQAQTKLDDLYNRLLASQQTQALQLYQTASPGVVSGIETGLTGTGQANNYAISELQTALNTAGVVDNYTMQSILAGLQNDQNARASMNNFYGALGNVLASK